MKSFARKAALLVLVLAGACSEKPTSAAVGVAMSDPLIGLAFDPGITEFEEFPHTVDTPDTGDDQVQWVFASFHDNQSHSTYWVVAGFQRIEPDTENSANGVLLEPDFGAVLRTTDSDLIVLGVPDRLFEAEQPLLPPEITEGLLCDAADRYVRAFGGASGLSMAFKDQAIGQSDLPRPLAKCLFVHGVAFFSESS